MYLLHETCSSFKRYVGLCHKCHKEELGGPTLAEERKEQLEQLPPPKEDHGSALSDQVVSIQ